MGVVVVAIIGIVAFLYFIKMVFDHEKAKMPAEGTAGEIAALKKRMAVLERIVTDQGHSLAAEIAALEDLSDEDDDLGAALANPRERARHTL